MIAEQWFAILILSVTGAFLLPFASLAWATLRVWRAEKVIYKQKRVTSESINVLGDDTPLDSFDFRQEHFTPDWEKEIHRINRDSAKGMAGEQKRHIETVAELQRDRAKSLLDVQKRRNKEEAGTDDTTTQ